MARTPPQVVRLDFTPQSSPRLLPLIEDDHLRRNLHAYVGEEPYSDPAAYEGVSKASLAVHLADHPRIHQRSPILTNALILVRPTEASDAPQGAYYGSTHTCPLYAPSLPGCWVIPVMTQTIIPSAPATHFAPSASVPALPPAPTTDRRSGTRTQREEDLLQLEQTIESSPWHAANALEPKCGDPDCPYLADRYGIRGMSCYTAFATKPDGTFGCWREECSSYSARRLEDAVKHQRTCHFNHKPFLCVPMNGTVW